MKERGIIMRDWEVRAIREGRKTQKRMVVKSQRHPFGHLLGPEGVAREFLNSTEAIRCPYGQPGDRLWVKETWGMSFEDIVPSGRQFVSGGTWGSPANPNRKPCVVFKADGDMPDDSPGETATWCSPIFMPRWASRINLPIEFVRAQRLQDITAEDAIAEGIEEVEPGMWRSYHKDAGWLSVGCPITSYRSLWESINGKGSWNLNQWVFAIEFRRVQK